MATLKKGAAKAAPIAVTRLVLVILIAAALGFANAMLVPAPLQYATAVLCGVVPFAIALRGVKHGNN